MASADGGGERGIEYRGTTEDSANISIRSRLQFKLSQRGQKSCLTPRCLSTSIASFILISFVSEGFPRFSNGLRGKPGIFLTPFVKLTFSHRPVLKPLYNFERRGHFL